MKPGRKGSRDLQRAGSQTPSASRPSPTRRQFTQEFKLEAVRLVAHGTRRTSEVARELGIRADLLYQLYPLYQWKRQAEARAGQSPADVFPGKGNGSSRDDEIRQLRRENAQLREERDSLGKATACFARSTR